MNIRKARQFLWIVWHTRPGHKPYGMVTTRNGVYCMACGSPVPLLDEEN